MRHLFNTKVLWLIFFCSNIIYGQKNHSNFPVPLESNKVIVFKLKNSSDNNMKTQMEHFLAKLSIADYKLMFPFHKPPEKEKDIFGNHLVDLSAIYKAEIKKGKSTDKVLQQMINSGLFEYAEYLPLPELLYVPNDQYGDTASSLFRQYYLEKVSAYAAWDIQQGDTSVIIAIVDTGTDLDHPDLEHKIKKNYSDPIDGVDNDNDGYIDNFMGWDYGDYDNDPTDEHGHGTVVAGISCAETDNFVGIASLGFNALFLPVKVMDSSDAMPVGYEGIVYAADHGAKVINCSWGGTTGGGTFGQDVINYATFNKNAFVLGAAGNSDDESVYYPASYDHVFSVSGTDENDIKTSGGAVYNIFVDACAPGINIFAPYYNGAYLSTGGTSFATPIVAGAASLLFSEFPDYHALQIAEKIRVNADNIDTLPGNANFAGKLGAGRINIFNAITDTIKPSIRNESFNYLSMETGMIQPGDTFHLSGVFKNYLHKSYNMKCRLSSVDPHISIIDSTATLGQMETLSEKNTASQPFIIQIGEDVPLNHFCDLKFSYIDTAVSSFEWKQFIFNQAFLKLNTELLSVAVNSDGRMLYLNEFNQHDLGFIFEGQNILSCGGLMIGVSSNQVSDNVYGGDGYYSNDFAVLEKISPQDSVGQDFDLIVSKFNDSLAATNALDVEITQRAFAWPEVPGRDNFIILEYQVVNTGDNALSSLYAGFFADWDLSDYSKNRAQIDENQSLAYVFADDQSMYAGIKNLSDYNFTHYAIDNDGTGGDINLYDQNYFSAFEKYYVLRTNRQYAGLWNDGNDVSHVLSNGPFYLEAGDTLNFYWALVAGNHFLDILNAAQTADTAFHEMLNSTPEPLSDEKHFGFDLFPNPASDKFTIAFNLKTSDLVHLQIRNISGKTVYDEQAFLNKGQQKIEVDVKSLSKGTYIISLDSKKQSATRKIQIK